MFALARSDLLSKQPDYLDMSTVVADWQCLVQNKRQDFRHHSEVSDWECWHKKPRGEGSTWVLVVYLNLLLMEEILHHLGCIKPMVNNEIFYHIKWDFWTINRTIRKQPYNRSTSAVAPKLPGYRWFVALCFGILEIPLSKNPFA